MDYLLRGLLLLHPFVQYLFIGKHMLTIFALSGIVFSFLIFLFFLRNDKEKQSVQFPYIWLWIFIQVIWINGKSLLSIPKNMHISLFYLIHISVFFLAYYSVVFSKVNWKYIMKPLGYVCVVMSIFSIFDYLGLRQFKYYDTWENPGMLGNPTNTLMYITATAPFLLLHKRGWIAFIIPLIALCFIHSSSALLGIWGIVASYLLIKKYYKRLFLLLGGSILTLIIKFKSLLNAHDYDKLYIWSLAIKDWMKSVWFGLGLGNFENRYTTNHGTIRWEFMHNHYLYVLYTLGIIGLFLLAYFLISIFKNAWKIRQEATLPLVSIISVILMSAVSVPMNVYPIVLLTAVNLGILTKEDK